MKKSLIGLVVLLLPGWVLAQALRLEPNHPRPGQQVTLTYDPAKTKLAGASTVNFVVYWLRPEGEPSAQEITPTRSGGTFQATFVIPDTAAAMAFVFEHDERRDTNGGQGYAQQLFRADGGTAPGSYVSLAQAHLNYYTHVRLEDRDTQEARALFEREFREYPASKRKYLSAYLTTLNPRHTEDRAAILRITEQVAALPDLTADELNAIANGYHQAGKSDQEKAIREKRKQQFGDAEPYHKIYKIFASTQPMTLAERGKAYENVQKEYRVNPKPSYHKLQQGAYQMYLQMLSDSGRTAEFQALVQSAPTEYQSITMSIYNRIARKAVSKGEDLERSAELGQQAVDWAKRWINQPRDSINDSPSLTATQIRSNRQADYARYADTYAQLLYKQGKVAEALPYFEDAAKIHGRYNNAERNERYLTVLQLVKPEAVQAEASAMLRIGKSTPTIEQLLHQAYVSDRTNEAEYESYLAGLRKEAATHRRTELQEKMIARPAPDFDLMNLEGKPVRLADLKGKVIILDFWATWCGPCIASFPGMQKAQAHFEGNPDVVFLFVNSLQQEPDKRKVVADFIAKNEYPFTVLMDEKDEVIRAFKVWGIPTKFIIDKAGIIRFRSVGQGFETDEMLVEGLSTMIEMAGEPTK